MNILRASLAGAAAMMALNAVAWTGADRSTSGTLVSIWLCGILVCLALLDGAK